MKKILFFLVFILGLLIIYELFKEEINNYFIKYSQTIDANSSISFQNEVNESNNEKTISSASGKSLFNRNCASCHNLDNEIIDPKLAKVDSLNYFNWLTNKDFEKIEQGKGFPIVKNHQVYTSILNNEEINLIYAYLKSLNQI